MGISSQLLQQSEAAAPYTLDKEYLLTNAPPDLERGIAPLGPPVPTKPLLLGHGVGPPGRRPWPRVLGRGAAPPCRPQPLLLTLDKGYFLTASLPDLQRGKVNTWRQ